MSATSTGKSQCSLSKWLHTSFPTSTNGTFLVIAYLYLTPSPQPGNELFSPSKPQFGGNTRAILFSTKDSETAALKTIQVQFTIRRYPTHPAIQAELAAFPPGREPLQWDSARFAVTGNFSVPGNLTGHFLLCPGTVALLSICQMDLSTCCRKLAINYIVNVTVRPQVENYVCNWSNVFKTIQIISKCWFILTT